MNDWILEGDENPDSEMRETLKQDLAHNASVLVLHWKPVAEQAELHSPPYRWTQANRETHIERLLYPGRSLKHQ